jgi:endoglucanase
METLTKRRAVRASVTLVLLGAALACGWWVRAAELLGIEAEGARRLVPGDRPPPLPALPLSTSSRWIVDAAGRRVKLAGVNWFGAEELDHVVGGLDHQPLPLIARRIRQLGFNVVRVPWSNEMVQTDPVIADERLAANPTLQGKRAMGVLDAVVDALGAEGLMVVLCNHVSRAEWCCTDNDGNGLWWNARYPERNWLADWRTMALRYRDRPFVIGADLRNEPRSGARWGGPGPLDWRGAAERGGKAVLDVAPQWLIIVEGVSYATDLTGAYSHPLSFPGRLVYSVHDYSWFHKGVTTYEALHKRLGDKWGFLLTQHKRFTAPVWVGEFGTFHRPASIDSDTDSNGLWFRLFRRYLRDADIDWCYWGLNGTMSRGTGRTLGAEEGYGVLDVNWREPALAEHSGALQDLQEATQGPR